MRWKKLEFYENKRSVDFTNESAKKTEIPIENTTAPRVSGRKLVGSYVSKKHNF